MSSDVPRTIAVFANPSAGQGRATRALRGVLGRLAEAGLYAQPITTHPAALADEDIPRPLDLAIVIGGDGTVRSVVERLSQLPVALPKILVVSMGTANLISQYLKLAFPGHLGHGVVQTIANHRVHHLDWVEANGNTCLMMASVGFDAHVVHELTHQRTGPIHLLSYVLPTLKTLATMRYPVIDVWVDKAHVFTGPAMAVVANLDVYGTGFPMAIHARPDDGLLDVCLLPMRSVFDVMEVAATALVGEHLEREGVIYARGTHVRITAEAPVAVQVDGDACGFTPLEVRLLARQIPFLGPAGG